MHSQPHSKLSMRMKLLKTIKCGRSTLRIYVDRAHCTVFFSLPHAHKLRSLDKWIYIYYYFSYVATLLFSLSPFFVFASLFLSVPLRTNVTLLFIDARLNGIYACIKFIHSYACAYSNRITLIETISNGRSLAL